MQEIYLSQLPIILSEVLSSNSSVDDFRSIKSNRSNYKLRFSYAIWSSINPLLLLLTIHFKSLDLIDQINMILLS
jgi:hypothetical protein